MSSRRPPWLALFVLEHCVPDGSSIAGDLVEEFDRGRSSAWLWWQVLAAVTFARRGETDEIRPLRLVELQPCDAQERSRRFLALGPVNLTASPVHGVGGLGLVILACIVSVLQPGMWVMLIATMAGGLVLGSAMIARHRATPFRPYRRFVEAPTPSPRTIGRL